MSQNTAYVHKGGDAEIAAFGCNGKTAQTTVTVAAAATDLATALVLVNQLRALLIANGQAV